MTEDIKNGIRKMVAIREAVRVSKVPLPEDKWVSESPYEMDEDQREEVWDMFTMSYKDIGLKFSDIEGIVQKYDSIWLTDLDPDPAPDAFITYSKRYAGNKVGLAGSDGSSAAKSAVVNKMVNLLNSSGWWAEASHEVEKILDSKGAPVVKEKERALNTLHKYDRDSVDWIGDGWYERYIDGVGEIKKRLFGNPKV